MSLRHGQKLIFKPRANIELLYTLPMLQTRSDISISEQICSGYIFLAQTTVLEAFLGFQCKCKEKFHMLKSI